MGPAGIGGSENPNGKEKKYVPPRPCPEASYCDQDPDDKFDIRERQMDLSECHILEGEKRIPKLGRVKPEVFTTKLNKNASMVEE